MAGWALTAGLQNLRNQVNEVFPFRDKTSDGTIGDAAHRAESSSGHNPDDTPGSRPEWNGDPDSTPEVRAWDMDSDLGCAGVTAQMVVDHVRSLPGVSSVLRYLIYNRKIYEASNSWQPRPYTGASAHTEHIHFSGAFSQAADQNTSFDYRLEELVALSADDKTWLTTQIAGVMKTKVTVGTDQWEAATAIGYAARKTFEIQKDVPTASENAQAVLTALCVGPIETIVLSLKAVLGDKAAAVGAGLQQ